MQALPVTAAFNLTRLLRIALSAKVDYYSIVWSFWTTSTSIVYKSVALHAAGVSSYFFVTLLGNRADVEIHVCSLGSGLEIRLDSHSFCAISLLLVISDYSLVRRKVKVSIVVVACCYFSAIGIASQEIWLSFFILEEDLPSVRRQYKGHIHESWL